MAQQLSAFWQSLLEEDDDEELKKRASGPGMSPKEMLDLFLKHAETAIDQLFDKVPDDAKKALGVNDKAQANALASHLRDLMKGPESAAKLSEQQLNQINNVCKHPTIQNYSEQFKCTSVLNEIAQTAQKALQEKQFQALAAGGLDSSAAEAEEKEREEREERERRKQLKTEEGDEGDPGEPGEEAKKAEEDGQSSTTEKEATSTTGNTSSGAEKSVEEVFKDMAAKKDEAPASESSAAKANDTSAGPSSLPSPHP